MSIYLQDPDVTLHHGDVLETLREMPDGSVDCVITSPPYWGLRDYGTGTWEGGEEGCDHLQKVGGTGASTLGAASGGNDMSDEARERSTTRSYVAFTQTCGKCGATRIDNQLGLEPTPEEYVARMVEVFREVRRVLAKHGTCWVNMGDSYASNPEKGGSGPGAKQGAHVNYGRPQVRDNKAASGMGAPQRPPGALGLKPKDLAGMPWRVAFALQADGWYLRSDIIWSKPNPMPESVTDRPTKAHEYVFLLTKSPRYFFDQEAVREKYLDGPGLNGGAYDPPGQSPHSNARGPDGRRNTHVQGQDGSIQHRDGERWPNSGRNIRSVWEIATQPFPEAHFATFPEELVRRCLLAGCAEGGIVLDPFMGSGTVALVARKHARRAVGIELNESYCAMAARRLGQQSLFAA